MTPILFPQANCALGPPEGFVESQIQTVPAYRGIVDKGSCEGCHIIVVAHLPTQQELADIMQGKPIFLTCFGGLPPHMLTTDYFQAVNPA